MPAKMRLQRHGKKGQPFYHIVVADGRAPRDGKYIEKLGTYNPMKNPAEIDINVDKAVQWLNNGAQPTDTMRRILSYKGVLLKKHLLGGVTKGALTQEQADVKFNQWLQEKEQKVNNKVKDIEAKSRNAVKSAFDAEIKANAEKAAFVAKKREAKVAVATEEAVEEQPQDTAAPAEEAPVEAAQIEETPEAEA